MRSTLGSNERDMAMALIFLMLLSVVLACLGIVCFGVRVECITSSAYHPCSRAAPQYGFSSYESKLRSSRSAGSSVLSWAVFGSVHHVICETEDAPISTRS